MPYIINNKTFKTKETLSNYFSYILNHSKLNEALIGEYKEGILSLIKEHPDALSKIGVGIKEVKVEKHSDVVTNFYPHFHIYRVDGTNEDFSYKKCIANLKSSSGVKASIDIVDIKSAARHEVRDFIFDFKTKAFLTKKYLKCPILNINTSKKSCHIDHAPPLTFDQLFYNFLSTNNLNIKSINIISENGINKKFEDRRLAKKWTEYHNNNAVIRVVHGAANLSQKKAKVNWKY